jgi:tetratricopeptide (TPR) repeat protein
MSRHRPCQAPSACWERVSVMPAERAQKTRLTTWKEVAAFFGKTERTVMRWEAERGLPVRRLPGETRSSIYAEVAELESWLRGPGAAVPELSGLAAPQLPQAIPQDAPGHAVVTPPASLAPRAARPWGRIAVACAAATLILALIVARALPHASPPPPAAAQVLYMKGLQDWAQRTPASLNQAVDEFTAAISIDEQYAEAYVGLANCYNLLREFTAMPSAQAYALAKQSALRAIALQPRLASAHAAYAFALSFGDWNFTASLREYETALRLEPDNPGIHHWYATTLLTLGDDKQALAQIDRALELDPSSRAVRADRALIISELGRGDEARAVLTELAASAPDFLSPHAYLAHVFMHSGDDSGFLREQMIFAQLQHDSTGEAIVRAASRGFAAGGHAGMLAAMLTAQKAAVASGSGSAADVAATYALLGDSAAAVAWVTRAVDRHDDRAVALLTGGYFRRLVGDEALRPIWARLRLPSVQSEIF